MTARSVWTGHIQFKSVNFGCRLYSGVESDSIRLNQLHKTDHGRIKQSQSCATCGEALGRDDIVKGYEAAPGQFVLITKSETELSKAEKNKVIEIDAFVSGSEIPTELYSQPHIIGPDKEVSQRGYALLRDTLTATDTVAVGRIVIRDAESPVAIVPTSEGILALHKLRFPEQIRSAADVGVTALPPANSDEIALATQLVDGMRKPFAKLDMVDQTSKTLREIIDAKIDASEWVASDAASTAPATIDLMDALRQSIPKAKPKRKTKTKANPKKRKAA